MSTEDRRLSTEDRRLSTEDRRSSPKLKATRDLLVVLLFAALMIGMFIMPDPWSSILIVLTNVMALGFFWKASYEYWKRESSNSNH